MENEKKIVVAYTVKRYEDGSVGVEDAKLEGSQPITANAIFKDIEDVAEMTKLKRIENSAYSGVMRFYEEAQARQQEAEKAAAPAEPTIE